MTKKYSARLLKRDSFHIARSRTTPRSRRVRNDDGSMLVEVLVALLILVIVFTSALLALSDMASKRVAIEQRDRAVRLITEYEELSRIFRCGLIVDRENISNAETVWEQKIERCAFQDQIEGTSTRNAGDQTINIDESTGDGTQEFTLHIRYWWEVPGSDLHRQNCSAIFNAANNPVNPEGILPSIMVRAFLITWTENGNPMRETLIKKDPIPVDTAIFASGNRYSYLTSTSNARLALSTGSNPHGVERILDSTPLFPGQPQDCSWFPYLTARNPSELARVNGSSVPQTSNPGGAVT